MVGAVDNQAGQTEKRFAATNMPTTRHTKRFLDDRQGQATGVT